MLVKARMQVDEAKAYNDTIISDIESRAHEKTEDIQTRLDQQQQQHLQQQQQLQQQLHTLRSFWSEKKSRLNIQENLFF